MTAKTFPGTVEITHGDEVLCSEATNVELLSPCTHEDTDTRVLLHAVDGVKQGRQNIVIRTVDTEAVVLTVDTDVVVLAVDTDVVVLTVDTDVVVLTVDNDVVVLTVDTDVVVLPVDTDVVVLTVDTDVVVLTVDTDVVVLAVDTDVVVLTVDTDVVVLTVENDVVVLTVDTDVVVLPVDNDVVVLAVDTDIVVLAVDTDVVVLTVDTDVVVLTVDIDVVVLAVSFARRLGCESLVAAIGTEKSFRYDDATAIAHVLGVDKCKALPVFHALTGCHTTSCFAGRGKRTAWISWNAFSSVTPALGTLADTPSAAVLGEVLPTIEMYVVLYDRGNSEDDVNCTRQVLFTQKGREIEKIPPTQNALM